MAVSILNYDQQRNLMEEPAGVSFNWTHVKLLQLFIGLIYMCSKSLFWPHNVLPLWGWGEHGEKPVVEEQAAGILNSNFHMSIESHNPANTNVHFLLHLFWLSPSSCVDVFTSLWKEANDNSIFL